MYLASFCLKGGNIMSDMALISGSFCAGLLQWPMHYWSVQWRVVFLPLEPPVVRSPIKQLNCPKRHECHWLLRNPSKTAPSSESPHEPLSLTKRLFLCCQQIVCLTHFKWIFHAPYVPAIPWSMMSPASLHTVWLCTTGTRHSHWSLPGRHEKVSVPVLGWCWANVVDGRLTSTQHRDNFSCLLGIGPAYQKLIQQ